MILLYFQTYLPKLSVLKASHNYLTILERDFHGLPVLCSADLSNNQIVALGRELVSRTRCKIENGLHEGAWDTLKIYLEGMSSIISQTIFANELIYLYSYK